MIYYFFLIHNSFILAVLDLTILIQVMQNKLFPVSDTARTRLLPFDEISLPKNELRKRNKTVLTRYFDHFLYAYKQNRNQKLTILSKINDRSYQQISFKQSFYEKINKIFNSKFRIFHPDQNFMIWWNVVMLITIGFNFFQIPISLLITNFAQRSQLKQTSIFALNIIFICLLFIDIFLVRFNLAFFRYGKLVSIKSQIMKNYLKRDFWLDFIAWFVYLIYIICADPQLIYLKLLFYLKCSTLMLINMQISFTLSIHRVRFGLYKLFRVIIFTFFVITWVSSIYFAIDYYFYLQKGYYQNTGQLWLTNSNAVDNINIIQTFDYWYIWFQYAVYWAFQTASGVGYGDMTPRNPHQVLYCNIIILTNTILFSFYINSIWEIIGQMKEYENKYIENWANLRNYLKNQNLPKKLNHNIGNFLQEMWINQNQDYGEQQFMNNLSIQLKNQLHLLIRGKIFDNLPIFQQMKKYSTSWNQFVKQLVFGLQKIKVGSGQDIYGQGDFDQYLYFLSTGKASLYIKNLQIGKQIVQNEYFGIFQFMSETPRMSIVYSLSFCVLWRITRTQFLTFLRKYPHLYQKYCELKERVIYQGQISLCNTKCLKCQSEHHNFQKCPKINKWRNKIIRPLFIKKQLDLVNNVPRKNYIRNNYKMAKLRQVFLKDHEINCQKATFTKGYRTYFNLQ